MFKSFKKVLKRLEIETFSDDKLVKIYGGDNLYKVYDKYPNKREAAKILDMINFNLIDVIKHINNKYNKQTIHSFTHLSKEDKTYLLNSITRMKANYRPINVRENIPVDKNDDTSYTINKGAVFALCLRFADARTRFHDLNTIMFVALHELSHLFSKTYGHDKQFWTAFKFILQNAVEIGLYIPIDYRKKKVPYCGIEITYNPLNDHTLKQF